MNRSAWIVASVLAATAFVVVVGLPALVAAGGRASGEARLALEQTGLWRCDLDAALPVGAARRFDLTRGDPTPANGLEAIFTKGNGAAANSQAAITTFLLLSEFRAFRL